MMPYDARPALQPGYRGFAARERLTFQALAS